MRSSLTFTILIISGIFLILLSFTTGEKFGDYHKYYFGSSLLSGGFLVLGFGMFSLIVWIFQKKKSL